MIYLKETYDQLIKKSYGYDETYQSTCPAWQLIKDLYQGNYIIQAYRSNIPQQVIPKKIHQIWLGKNPIPEIYYKYMASWEQYHPDWEYRLWRDTDVNELNITSKKVYDLAINPGMRSDLVRYEILKKYGGLYVDTDFECLKPFDDLLWLNFFTGVSYDRELVLYNGLIASIPNHPILDKTVQVNQTYTGDKGTVIINLTGAYHFTRSFMFEVTKDKNSIVAFPMPFFYPYPNNVRKTDIDPYTFITPVSYAIHHWGVSWVKSKRNGLDSRR